jgi:hypothetical protein
MLYVSENVSPSPTSLHKIYHLLEQFGRVYKFFPEKSCRETLVILGQNLYAVNSPLSSIYGELGVPVA